MDGLPCVPFTCVRQVDRHSHQQPDRAAVRFRGSALTWRALAERTRRLAAALADRGVGAGDRVLLLATNRPEFIESVIAINRLGAIAVPVNFRLVAREVEYLAADSGAGAVIVEDALVSLVAGVRETGGLPCLVVGRCPDQAGLEDYEQVLAASGEHPGAGPDDLNAIALIMYTSGTTGRPKGAMLTYQNLLAEAFCYFQTGRIFDENDVTLVTAPMFHIAAVGAIVPNLLVGGTMVITPTGNFDAETFLDLAESERVSNAFLVPTQWQAVCASPTLPQRKLALHTIAWGAAPASVSLLRAMAEAFPDAANVCTFGQTEMAPLTMMLPGKDAIRKMGSIGKPFPLAAVRVVDLDMNDVPVGEVGEIVYRGPMTMAGYWNNTAATRDAFRGGWFHSGDLVRVDEDGFFYVVDRLKDMIISGGENIYSAEVEAVIAEHPLVREVAVVGAPHPTWGETPVAFVTLTDPRQALAEQELIAFTQARLASYKKPTSVVVMDELPRNASGKLLKQPLRDRVREAAEDGAA